MVDWVYTDEATPEVHTLCLVAGGHGDLFVAAWNGNNWSVLAPKGLRLDHPHQNGWVLPKGDVYAWREVDFDIPANNAVEVMEFGKHKGMPIRDLPDEYLTWMCHKINQRKYRLAAQTEIRRRRAKCGKSGEGMLKSR